jgi:predicted AAA+ superfamily ATPase
MENVIYSELKRRGYDVDVGHLESFSRPHGTTIRCTHEIDFVVNRGYERIYIQSAWMIPDEEKMAHPEHSTTGGYLKTVDFKTACSIMWDNMADDEKDAVWNIPNFDAKVFEEITGIKVN